MLLGFQDRFHPMLLDGSKRHTIRAPRKISPKVGEVCHCYGKVRQKGMHLLGRWPCVRVEDIRIWRDDGAAHLRPGASPQIKNLIVTREAEEFPYNLQVEIDGERLSRDERESLARRDGFEDFEAMVMFWRKEHGKGKRIDFHGDVIHWDFDHPVR